MRKSNEKGLKKTAKLTGAIVFIVVFTALMALLGFHLASRYRATREQYEHGWSKRFEKSELAGC